MIEINAQYVGLNQPSAKSATMRKCSLVSELMYVFSKINDIIMVFKLYLINGNYVFLDKLLAVCFIGVFKMKWVQSVLRPHYA